MAAPTWLPGARHIWMCALFGVPSALGPDPSTVRVHARVSEVYHQVLRGKTHRKETHDMVWEGVWTDMYVLDRPGTEDDRDVVGFRVG